MTFIPMGFRKIYNEPQANDTVFHIDEPYTECYGKVAEVNNDVFMVYWSDGQKESYDPADHPDIFQVKAN